MISRKLLWYHAEICSWEAERRLHWTLEGTCSHVGVILPHKVEVEHVPSKGPRLFLYTILIFQLHDNWRAGVRNMYNNHLGNENLTLTPSPLPTFEVRKLEIMEAPFQLVKHWKILGVSKNRGTPKSSILIGVSLINHPFWEKPPIFGSTPTWKQPNLSNSFRNHGFQVEPHFGIERRSSFFLIQRINMGVEPKIGVILYTIQPVA